MNSFAFNPALPDPAAHPEFYSGVTVKRGIAWIIDSVIVALVTALIVIVTLGASLLILPVVWLAVGFVYRTITLAARSATPGMQMMNILFLTRNGERFDFAHAILHTLGYTLSIGTFLLQMGSILLMFVSSRGQGLTDHVLGTVAINRPA